MSKIWYISILVIVSLAASLLTPVVLASGIYTYYRASERILPGISVGDTPIGGQKVSEAAASLEKGWNQERSILVADGFQTRQVSPADLGLHLDVLSTLQKAYAIGRVGGILSRQEQMIYTLHTGWTLSPVIQFDAGTARAGLETLSSQMSKPPKDAALKLEGVNLIPVPGELGYAINIEETLKTLAADPAAVLTNRYLKISLQPVAPRINDVSAAKAEAERLIHTPMSISAYDPISDEHFDWPIPQEVLASWLKLKAGDQGPLIGYDEGKLGEFLTAKSETLGPERWLDAARYSSLLAQALEGGQSPLLIVSHRATTYVVQPGDTLIKIGWKVGMPYWKILEANPDVKPDSLWAGQQLVIPSKDELLPLPVIPNKRIVISISQQRLWIYQDGSLLSKHIISTGIDRSPTQPGVFQVQTHELNAYASVWDLYMPHFLGVYEAWPGFMNGIHGLPTLSNGRRLWASILGKPASYGCIILDLNAAEYLYNWAENGVVVEIQP
jgi:LysM repeat protein